MTRETLTLDDRRGRRPSLAIVITFFGHAPMWLPAFLVSCRANADVRWFLYTDVDVGAGVPPNVTVRRMDVAELGRRASAVLGTGVEIRVTYTKKISDIKPTYGLLFADDLHPFDFWAHADLDIVWGDVRQFMTDAILSRHDIISSRAGRTSGHFTLYRNTPAINRTFELIPDAAQAMANPQYLHLDERELTHHLKQHLGTPAALSPRVHWPEELTTNAAYQRAVAVDQSLWWRRGKTFGTDGREFMYIHFHKLKQNMTTINFEATDAPVAFRIDRSGFTT